MNVTLLAMNTMEIYLAVARMATVTLHVVNATKTAILEETAAWTYWNGVVTLYLNLQLKVRCV